MMLGSKIITGSDKSSIVRAVFRNFTESRKIPIECIKICTGGSPLIGTPVAAGWPGVFLSAIPNSRVIGFDINSAQLNRFAAGMSPDDDTALYLGDISHPNLKLFLDLAQCDYVFMSNIADWIYKNIDRERSAFFDNQGNPVPIDLVGESGERVESFIDCMFAVLTNGNISKRILFSSCDVNVLNELLAALHSRATSQGYDLESRMWKATPINYSINEYLEVWVG